MSLWVDLAMRALGLLHRAGLCVGHPRSVRDAYGNTKLGEIGGALVAAGYDTTAKQAAVLGVCRATAWVVLNRDKRVGPSASVIKRILSSPNVPPPVRRKIEEYIQERISGLYGHCVSATRAFCRSVAFGTVAGTGQANPQPTGGATD